MARCSRSFSGLSLELGLAASDMAAQSWFESCYSSAWAWLPVAGCLIGPSAPLSRAPCVRSVSFLVSASSQDTWSQCCTRSSKNGTKARSSFLLIFGTRSRYKFHR
uniref:Putative secreted protein n=1 Tax=Ixodes ricinus TaxID=34613 RepID=A0A6B0UGH9_IXORI